MWLLKKPAVKLFKNWWEIKYVYFDKLEVVQLFFSINKLELTVILSAYKYINGDNNIANNKARPRLSG
jgi:hypothetical protein